MEKNGKKVVLVTGSAGFIGFHVAKRFLDEGYKVIGVDCISDYYDKKLKLHREGILIQNPAYKAINEKIETYSQELPILEDDTQNIIEYVKNTQTQKKKKYYFWELLDKND